MYIVGLEKANLQPTFLVHVLPESSDVIRKHTWTARHRCCTGCIKHLTQPSVLQYVNETVVQCASCFLSPPRVQNHEKWMGHDNTHARYVVYLSVDIRAECCFISGQNYREKGKNTQPC